MGGTRDGAAVREVDRILGTSVSSSQSRLQHPRSANSSSFVSAIGTTDFRCASVGPVLASNQNIIGRFSDSVIHSFGKR